MDCRVADFGVAGFRGETVAMNTGRIVFGERLLVLPTFDLLDNGYN